MTRATTVLAHQLMPPGRIASIQQQIQMETYLPIESLVLIGRPALRVAKVRSVVESPRRSRRLAAKPKVANPALQAQKVLMVKLDLAQYESTFAGPLSESKHEAFRVLFQEDAFLDDFTEGVCPGEQ
jgi:hypothetical protein